MPNDTNIDNLNIGEPPEEKKAFDCDICGEPIMVGDDYYNIGGQRICADCVYGSYETAEEDDGE